YGDVAMTTAPGVQRPARERASPLAACLRCSEGSHRGPVDRYLMDLLMDSRGGSVGSVEGWMEPFAALWRCGRASLEKSTSIFGPGIHLSAPGLRSTTGHAAGREAFRKTFDVFPDMSAAIEGWAEQSNALYIEMTFTATVGGKPMRWRRVDRFRIENGVIVE